MLLFSWPVISDSLWPHGLQHARPPCPSPFPRVCPTSCSLHQWCHPAISFFDPPSFPALSLSQNHWDFSNESYIRIGWSKYWHFSFSISPSSEYSGLISLIIDLFDLLALQGTSRSLLSHHSSKVSILWHSAFLMAQFSQLYVTTGKTIALTIWIFAGRIMSLLFNTLSRFVIAFLPRSKCLLISWLRSPFTVILEPKKRKSVTMSTFSPSTCHTTRLHDLQFF